MSVDLNTLRRLAYIRYLHHLAIEQARLQEPLSSASILMFHDAVESFLLLAAEHLGATPPHQFEQYWEALSPTKLAGGVELAMKQGMRRLNRVRTTLKHHGGHPDVPTIEQIKVDTDAFMAANTPVVFQLDYETVSMADIIPQPSVRDLVRQAETSSEAGDLKIAMATLSAAFQELFEPHSSRALRGGSPSPFRFGRNVGQPPSAEEISKMVAGSNSNSRGRFPAPSMQGLHLANHLKLVTDVVRELQQALRITALGVDFAAFKRFQTLIPEHSDYGGVRHFRALKGYAPTSSDFDFCRNFLVTMALRLADVETHLTQPHWIEPGKVTWYGDTEEIHTMSIDD